MDNYYQDEFYRMKASRDWGRYPNILDIKKATLNNENYRTALWSGNHLQLTVMNIPVNEDIGLELHPDVDQFLYIIDGTGIVHMGDRQDNLTNQQMVFEDDAIMIPAGTWHNVVNAGNKELKLFSIYGPPNHTWGTVHPTKEIA